MLKKDVTTYLFLYYRIRMAKLEGTRQPLQLAIFTSPLCGHLKLSVSKEGTA